MSFTRLITFAPWAVIVIGGVVANMMVTDLKADLKTEQSAKEKAESSLKLTASANESLSLAIKELKKSRDKDQLVANAINDFNHSVDKTLNKAVGEIGDLLDEEDNCGNKRLPDPVIERMWEHYRTGSDSATSDDKDVPTSRDSNLLHPTIRPSFDDSE